MVSKISGVHKLFNCLRNLAPSYLMNICQPVTSNLHRRRLRSAVRGGLIVPPTKTVRYGPCSFAALLSLGRQREMRYLHHYATTNSLPCHFVASWRLNYTWEHIIHTSTLVTVFTVRVGEHNFIVLTYLRYMPCGRHLAEKWLYPKRVRCHI